jgi:hypothetical protein
VKFLSVLVTLAAGAMVAALPLHAGSETLSFSVSGSITGTGARAFSGFATGDTGAGTGAPLPLEYPVTLILSGTANSINLNGTTEFAFGPFDTGPTSSLHGSFSTPKPPGTTFSFPITIDGGKGIFDDATGTLTADVSGTFTSIKTVDFTLTASGTIYGPDLPGSGSGPGSGSATPEPSTYALSGLALRGLAVLKRLKWKPV